MPSRGYRKGQSDSKIARPHLLRCRASTRTRVILDREAAARSMTLSGLIADILDAFAADRRLDLPQPRAITPTALRELARLGNNLNQIAQRAHLGRLHLLDADARACIAALNDLARRLRP